MPATDWLDAREAVDARSRSKELAKAFASVVGHDAIVVDLGCGTGSNIRYLAPYFTTDQKWLGLDHDSDLLSQAAARMPGVRITFEKMDLVTGVLNVPTGNGVAITASAFLDITSTSWLTQFANHCHDTPMLISMSAAGQPEWYPIDELDEPNRARMELHQKSDHGFGPSLGPIATQYLAKQLRNHGCQVVMRQSAWTLSRRDASLIDIMIGGIVRRVETPNDYTDAREWADLRRNQLQRDELRVVFKHVDLLSIPKRLGGTSLFETT